MQKCCVSILRYTGTKWDISFAPRIFGNMETPWDSMEYFGVMFYQNIKSYNMYHFLSHVSYLLSV